LRAHAAQQAWRSVPAPSAAAGSPAGETLRTHKQALGTLVSLEAGKVLSEGLGGAGDDRHLRLCRGLSRQLYGLTIASSSPATT
jgi:aldehyde dehydrogenase (NAD+)